MFYLGVAKNIGNWKKFEFLGFFVTIGFLGGLLFPAPKQKGLFPLSYCKPVFYPSLERVEIEMVVILVNVVYDNIIYRHVLHLLALPVV